MPALKRRRPSVTRLLWNKLTKPEAAIWDVGSARTRVMVGRKIIFDQPSCLLIRSDTGEAVATGFAAYASLGSGSQAVQVIFPIKKGCVADEDHAVQWLRSIREQIWPNRRWLPFSFSPGGVHLLAADVGPADREVWLRTFSSAGLHFVAPTAAEVALPLLLNMPESEILWVLSVGGDHSTIFLVQRGKILHSVSISWGGIQLTEALQWWMATQYGCQVSWKTAENIKLTTASYSNKPRSKFSVQGKNSSTQLGLSVSIATDDVVSWLAAASQPLILHLKQFLASLHSQQSTTCLENGLWLIGGGAQLVGMDSWLATQLNCAVTRVEKPTTAMLDAVGLITTKKA